MKSFEHSYLYEMPISHDLLSTMRALGEFRGREGMYTQQSPEVLETLRRVAIVQSVESSNRSRHDRFGEGGEARTRQKRCRAPAVSFHDRRAGARVRGHQPQDPRARAQGPAGGRGRAQPRARPRRPMGEDRAVTAYIGHKTGL